MSTWKVWELQILEKRMKWSGGAFSQENLRMAFLTAPCNHFILSCQEKLSWRMTPRTAVLFFFLPVFVLPQSKPLTMTLRLKCCFYIIVSCSPPAVLLYLCSHIHKENKDSIHEVLRMRALIFSRCSYKHCEWTALWSRNLGNYRGRCITFLCPPLRQPLRTETFSVVFPYIGQGYQFMRRRASLSSVWFSDSMSSVPASLKEAWFSRQQTHSQSPKHPSLSLSLLWSYVH